MAKPKAAHSFARVIEAFIGAIMVAAILNAFSSMESFPRWISHFVVLGSIFGTVIMVRDMQFWNHEYTIGWVLGLPVGIYIMIESGIISILDITLYTVVTVAGLYIKYLATSDSRKRVMR